ncbi:MAG: aminomethyl transferase family protein [Marinicaulis sp.]|nr:aminomethyltransferase family protein [Marinicaulis sp.]NNL87531.1 aminomethyl transferase family protein [Marinicaulis sp.]
MKLFKSAAKPVAVARELLPTPFFDKLDAVSLVKNWHEWNGYLVADVVEAVGKEYFAIRNQSTLFDISPMCKYRVKGPDALRVMNRLVIRDVAKIGVGRVGYAMWCDEEGMVIDDGTVFRYGDDEFMLLCQEHMFTWLHDCAWGFDVSITDETHNFCGLALQGPTSFSVLKEAGLESVADMKPFDLREIEPGLWISRTGYTGDLGYELFTDSQYAHQLWDRLWGAGHKLWGLIPIGFDALEIARLEVGFLAPGLDFQPVHVVSRINRGRTPFELGFGRLVNFEKGHFNGRRALLKHRDEGCRYHLVRLDIEGKEPAKDAFIYSGRDKVVGHVTSAVWSPTAKRNIALAELEAPYGGKVKNGLWAEIYVYKEGAWQRRQKKAVVVETPFFTNARSRKTPPDLF